MSVKLEIWLARISLWPEIGIYFTKQAFFFSGINNKMWLWVGGALSKSQNRSLWVGRDLSQEWQDVIVGGVGGALSKKWQDVILSGRSFILKSDQMYVWLGGALSQKWPNVIVSGQSFIQKVRRCDYEWAELHPKRDQMWLRVGGASFSCVGAKIKSLRVLFFKRSVIDAIYSEIYKHYWAKFCLIVPQKEVYFYLQCLALNW